MPKIAPCLWFDGKAEEAALFYTSVFPDSHVKDIRRAPAKADGTTGHVMSVAFTLLGMECVGLNGGPMFQFNEAVSFQVYTEGQAETDRLWNAIVADGGSAGRCAWCKDRFGLSWQVVPRRLVELMGDADADRARRAMMAMMTMTKIDIAAVEQVAG